MRVAGTDRKTCHRVWSAAVVVLLALGLQGCASGPSVSVEKVERAGVEDTSVSDACQSWLDNAGPSSGDFSLVGALPAKLNDAKALAISMGSNVSADPLFMRLPGDQSIVLCAAHGPLKELGYSGSKLIYYVIPDLQSSGLVGSR